MQVMESSQDVTHDEIKELESLIELESRKADLLRRKCHYYRALEQRKADSDDTKGLNEQKKDEVKDVLRVNSKEGSSSKGSSVTSTEHNPEPQEPESFRKAMKRMQKAGADLGNERNLLAWGRTALACARTFCAFLVLKGLNNFGTSAWIICSLGFILTSVAAMFTGLDHYWKVQAALTAEESVLKYQRWSNRYWTSGLLAFFLLAAIVTITKDWEK